MLCGWRIWVLLANICVDSLANVCLARSPGSYKLGVSGRLRSVLLVVEKSCGIAHWLNKRKHEAVEATEGTVYLIYNRSNISSGIPSSPCVGPGSLCPTWATLQASPLLLPAGAISSPASYIITQDTQYHQFPSLCAVRYLDIRATQGRLPYSSL